MTISRLKKKVNNHERQELAQPVC